MSCMIFCVRLKENKEAVGIFLAQSIEELQIIVDEEVTDPTDCEYVRFAKSGGLFIYEGQTEARFGIDWDGEGDDPPVFTGGGFGGELFCFLTDDKPRWKPLMEVDENESV